ncbi:MAG: acyl-CoA/acyl-ACP dehydrogenase, partial [Actinobacteria bacterium]|nr:acyl-CoA/acyl-ACP dehydrogenase [Actinomycetota bacterium]
MSYQFSAADREIQLRARQFVDEELIPSEVHAEMNQGEIPDDVQARHEKLVRDLGFLAINQPLELGGPGYTTRQRVLIMEQAGRVTNALSWVISTPPSWLPEVATSFQMERWVMPTIAGELTEAYAITEEHAGSDVAALTA